MNKEELNKILEDHKKLLSDSDTGKKADLFEADLLWADLRGADGQARPRRQAGDHGSSLSGVIEQRLLATSQGLHAGSPGG